MEGQIDHTVPLDYIEFQISPSQNRYEASVCEGNNIEMVKSAALEQLLLHLPAIKELHAKGSDAKYKLIAPDAPNGVRWFTKATLVSFLRVIGLPEVLEATSATRNEISQLEEARKFHFSLYAKGQNKFDSGKAGNSSNGGAPSLKSGISSSCSDDSKNELLRAIDLRLAALRGELATAFAEAAGATCSNGEMDYLEKFSHHFGATELRDSFCKLVELNQEKCPTESDSPNLAANSSGENRISGNQEINQNSKPPQTNIPVKYNASPAKAAQFERESSSDCGESSCSGEEEQPAIERSRTLIRSASPRRSASPMRRVQIGRSGSRRSTALTIKSLNCFPRERLVSQRDAAPQSSDEESSEQPSKKSESNVKRMSVQDAISLFESKQRDQAVDLQKTKSSISAAVGANKSVLRRWSAGAGEKFSPDPRSVFSENSVSLPSNNLESGDTKNGSSEAKPELDPSSEREPDLPTEIEIRSDSPEQTSLSPYCFQDNAAPPSQTAEIGEELIDSAKWSQQKEAELNQLLMKMMETKPLKYQTRAPENRKIQSLPNEQKGGFYDHYKEKRNEKLRHEASGKREEKEKQFRAMQQILDQRKAEMASANGSEAGKKHSVKAQKSQKTSIQPANPKREISKQTVVKKVSSKAPSSLPATRKSWPSTPSPRPTGISPVKTPPGMTSAGTTPTRKKQQPAPAPAVPRSSPKVERTLPKPKSIKSTQNDTKKSVKDVNEKKQQSLKKPTKPTKPKAQSINTESASSAKPSFYGKVTKKSSVVPVESKPFLRKGSGIGSGVSPGTKTKISSQPEEALTCTGDLKHTEENEIVSSSSDHAIELEMNLEPLKDKVEIELDSQTNQEKSEHVETPDEVTCTGDCFPSEPALNKKDAEESMISPTAWVEIEEHEEPDPCSDNTYQIESPQTVAPVGMPSSRVRHSLSQMLLEESSEPDVIEWGNAENPPALVYQKDVPKGLKRLLKFARKSKTDANSTGWSSPSIFSEGEDDVDESKLATRRSAENLLKKATLHAKNLGHQKASSHDKNLAAHRTLVQADISTTHGLPEKLQEGQISAPVTSTKATRSFFSLSAFKGGKQNEIKFR